MLCNVDSKDQTCEPAEVKTYFKKGGLKLNEVDIITPGERHAWCYGEKLAHEIVEKMGEQPIKSIFMHSLESKSAKAVSELTNFVFSMNVHRSGIQSLHLEWLHEDIVFQAPQLERLANICRFVRRLSICDM